MPEIAALSTPLCAPVNGQPASISAALSTYFSTASLQPSSLASYPATATGSSAISAILATSTPETSGGNPSDLTSYPLCAVSASWHDFCLCSTLSFTLAVQPLTNSNSKSASTRASHSPTAIPLMTLIVLAGRNSVAPQQPVRRLFAAPMTGRVSRNHRRKPTPTFYATALLIPHQQP